MRTEWSNKDSLEIPETTAGYGLVSWSDYKTGTSCDSVVLPIIEYANCLHYAVEAWQTEQKYMVNGQWKFPKGREKENERP